MESEIQPVAPEMGSAVLPSADEETVRRMLVAASAELGSQPVDAIPERLVRSGVTRSGAVASTDQERRVGFTSDIPSLNTDGSAGVYNMGAAGLTTEGGQGLGTNDVRTEALLFGNASAVRQEFAGGSTAGYDRVKKGHIVYQWDDGEQSRRVPYFLVPDVLMNDPRMFELVLERMRLPHPNLLLHFSALRLPVEDWNRQWNYDFTGDGEVDEEELPFPVPVGTSRTTESIQKYMAQVVRHRVLSIIWGVARACVQAGAFLMVSEHERGDRVCGMYDYVVPYVAEADVKDSVVLCTYCLEEREKQDGGKAFCDTLRKFAGDEKAEKVEDQPRTFVEDVTQDMNIMGLSKKLKGGKEVHKKVSQKVLYKHFQKRQFLPAKDVTHMLVFESKDSEEKFREILKARTPECNFVMNGGLSAMRFFEDSALKRATPFFVLQGTGGAADQCALVLQHMKWRKALDESAQADKIDANQSNGRDIINAQRKWWQFGSNKVATEANDALKKIAKSASQNIGGDSVRSWEKEKEEVPVGSTMLGNLISMKAQVVNELNAAKETGNLYRAMAMQKAVQMLDPVIKEGEEMNEWMKGVIEGENVTEEQMQSARARQLEFDLLGSSLLAKRHNLDIFESASLEGDDDETSATGLVGKKDKVKAKKALLNPKQIYYESLDLGRKGVRWEKAIGMTYEKWYDQGKPDQGTEMPEEWDIPWGGDKLCEKGRHRVTGERIQCQLETCHLCVAKKQAERAENRELARRGESWGDTSPSVRYKFIQYWIDDNPITDDPVLLNLFGEDQVADMARVILSNVWEPPVEDAMVIVDVLAKEMNIEEIMDDVTSAMSAGVADSAEVGEKTAMRRRLLEAWKLERILDFNSKRLSGLNHFLQFLVITFTLLSTVVGVMTVQVENAEQRVGRGLYPQWIEELPGPTFILIRDILRPINIVLPLLASFFLALISKISPATKSNLLSAAQSHVTSEIFKCRTRTGDYSPHMAGSSAPDDQEGGGGRDPKPGGAGAHAFHGPRSTLGPRSILANKIELVWSDLGSSEIRTAALAKPKGLELLDVGTKIKVDQHPALFEEGGVLQAGTNKEKVQEVIDQYAYEFVDDGLKPIGASDYIDIRVQKYLKIYEKRAPTLSWRLSVMQFFIFLASTTSTALGAFDLPAYIPIALGVGSAFGGIIAYQNLETRLHRVNAALVSLSRLMVWWHGLSVIEKRIPANKTFLVDTMEGIIQLESGNMVLNAKKSAPGQGGGQQTGENEQKNGQS